ncbi:MAG: hypothetical protein CL912_22930 [Deltaproteobacteria bacterium]|nr:hypothetical protein [Deltaproteobacteria bacterium]
MENVVSSGIGQTGAKRSRLGSTLPESTERSDHIRKEKENLPENSRSPNSEWSHFTPNALHQRSFSYLLTTPTPRGSRPNSINLKATKKDKKLDNMTDNSTPAPREEEGSRSRTSYSVQPVSRSPSLVGNDSADKSIILTGTHTYNQYPTMLSFITDKALKDGWSREDCDNGWQSCLAQSRREFRDKGRAYIQYNAEMNYWCNLCMYPALLTTRFHSTDFETVPDEVFHGRDPRTGEINMSTGRELWAAQRRRQRGQEDDDDASDLSRTRSPFSEPPRQRARTGTMADVHANGSRANGNGTNAN